MVLLLRELSMKLKETEETKEGGLVKIKSLRSLSI